MTKRAPLVKTIRLRGLEIAPAQVLGGVRLVPLLRHDVKSDLRIATRSYDALAAVSVDGTPDAAKRTYLSYVPHGLVVSWGDDGAPAAALGAQLGRPDGKLLGRGAVRLLHRMVKREEKNTLRMLPLHVAMEGFLALCFEGPDIAWTEYSRRALRTGLSPRLEWSAPGAAVHGLDDALRTFEIHERQVGMVVFVADALASAFVVAHPDDYRRLHASLLQDFYGVLLVEYAKMPPFGHLSTLAIDPEAITSIASLAAALETMRASWASWHTFLADGVVGREVTSKHVYQAGPFSLQRFMTDLALDRDNHIGEAIFRDDGELEYLKTYRLSAAQSRRAFLLMTLSKNNWNLDVTAIALKTTRSDLVQRLVAAGFGYLLADEVLRAARRS